MRNTKISSAPAGSAFLRGGSESGEKTLTEQGGDEIMIVRVYRYIYYAFPFRVGNARRICRFNGCGAEYAKDLTGLSTDTYMQAHERCCVENGEYGAALMQRDSLLVEFDHIHPDKTDCGAAGDGEEQPRRKQNRIGKIGRSEQNPGGLCWIGRFGFRRSGPEMRNGDVRGLSMIPDLCPGMPP